MAGPHSVPFPRRRHDFLISPRGTLVFTNVANNFVPNFDRKRTPTVLKSIRMVAKCGTKRRKASLGQHDLLACLLTLVSSAVIHFSLIYAKYTCLSLSQFKLTQNNFQPFRLYVLTTNTYTFSWLPLSPLLLLASVAAAVSLPSLSPSPPLGSAAASSSRIGIEVEPKTFHAITMRLWGTFCFCSSNLCN